MNRTVQRTRLVPHTVDGETELVLDRYEVEIPQPPRDWDSLVRTAVTASAALLVIASVIWSTASIGDLLSRVVHPAAAYGAAGAFDLLWIMCTAVEWLCRYDPDRATIARRGGVVALLIAMGAVGAHGYLAEQPVVGAVGALVSALAKGGTVLAITVHARPLDDRTQQWVQKRRAALDGQLAMIPVRRELQRGQAALDAEARALAADSGSGPDSDPENPDSPESGPEDPEPAVRTLHPGPVTVLDAVRTAVDSGIHEEDAVLRYVRKVADPNAKADTVSRYLRAARRTS
ncbi:protein transporter Sec31 [Streptomyces sp. NPDC053499]|uniref:protein transporter Sec31 n=1 Tax=Streptomyces sp. NPDC053499 TaxID=3365707 RepID=UPI0037D077E8